MNTVNPISPELRAKLVNACREAIDVQGACNLSGVVRSFARATEVLEAFGRATDVLWDVARHYGHATDWVNRHPVCRLFAEQVVWLTAGKSILSEGHKRDGFLSYTEASDYCEKMVAGQADPNWKMDEPKVEA